SELRPEDKEVLQYLAGRGGRVLESELRQKFLLPRTSVWRQVRRLERMGYVRVVKEGMQNAVELVKKGWKPIP
ncbi:MAG: winged helix-turn-helix transcriptional regulator, partial [candidate division KSB1 bacterium]|nr:winged helix-turn-helix transcriptional regulator [candidate division KSB1 bacterium]